MRRGGREVEERWGGVVDFTVDIGGRQLGVTLKRRDEASWSLGEKR